MYRDKLFSNKMVKYAKKSDNSKKNYYYYRRKRFKYIASNYSMAKFDIVRNIIYKNDGPKWSAPNSATMQLRYILNNSSDYQKYRQLYQSLKVCGLKIYAQ